MWAWPDIKRRILREAITGACFLLFGLFLLPIFIYLAGEYTLGQYREEGGLGAFLKDFYGYLPSGDLGAWTLVTGPYLIFLMLRVLIALWRLGRRERAVPESGA